MKSIWILQILTFLILSLAGHRIYGIETSAPEGIRYRAAVPDTLDLAWRGELALNAVTGTVSPNLDFESHWIQTYIPPGVVNHSHQWFDGNPRGLEIMTTHRLMNGSGSNLSIEEGMLNSMLSRIGDDGLYYNAPSREDASWRAGGFGGRKVWGTDEEISGIWGNAQFLVALIYRYQITKDPVYYKAAEGLANGLMRIVIRKDDYAYYPATPQLGFDHGYLKNSGWPETEEATNELDSPEGTVGCYITVVARSLTLWSQLSDDEEALETARLLVNYVMLPQFWLGDIENWGEEIWRVWRSHGGLQRKPAALFKGHIAGIAYTLQGLIEYAIAANDAYIKEFVRQAYEYIRNFGLIRIGMLGENIANSILASVAIRMSDAGIGDYYEDVDQYIRNQMVEDQFCDAEILNRLNREEGNDTEGNEWTVERLLGSLNHCGGSGPNWFLDPTGIGTYASPYLEPYYYVWESIIRHQPNETVHVNLLLNRASKWLDVNSHLPYEGKIDITNKTARNLFIRIPRWVNKEKVACLVDMQDREYFWSGNYLGLVGLKGNESITVRFQMVEKTETYYLLPYEAKPKWYVRKDELPKYILHMKGNTCVKVEFPNRDRFGEESFRYPIYQRDHYLQDTARTKEVTRFVADRLVKW